MNKAIEIGNAIRDLEEAKLLERIAKENRIEAEQELQALIPNDKLEGSVSYRDEDYTITVTNKISRQCNLPILAEISKSYPDDMKLVRTKQEFNLTGYRKLMDSETMNNELRQSINELITIKPTKPSVAIKRND